ncbi:hypothetical protein [Clostridium cibarium]|uniref:Uncharacterized protein n=1 Tax=Clostridium cibarium TaxID=2762247 RepID=A0ABR8PSL8_9CLOT|nr:hypothetical protein [Clostridium cibarium]MBD7911137.1 hypothetical protein [Clostridium cibarium]
MINIKSLNDSNSQIEILDMVSEVNIFMTLSDYDKSNPEVTAECNSYNCVKLMDNTLLYVSEEYKHYINLKYVMAITLKKYNNGYEINSETAYLYDTLANYNSEKAIELTYYGEVKEYYSGTDKYLILEDNEYFHIINVSKLGAVVVKNN